MISNELIFCTQIIVISLATLGALAVGREALTAMICLYTILANLFVTKQITLCGMETVSTDVFMIGGILGLNMMQEYFGQSAATKTIFINFFIVIFYLVMSGFLLWYTPNHFDTMHSYFVFLLKPMLRIITASVCVYLFVQIIDMYLYALLKKISLGKYLFVRNVCSLATTQLLDTILFSFAALYGVAHNIIHVIVVSYCVKLIVILCSTPFITFSKKIITYHHD